MKCAVTGFGVDDLERLSHVMSLLGGAGIEVAPSQPAIIVGTDSAGLLENPGAYMKAYEDSRLKQIAGSDFVYAHRLDARILGPAEGSLESITFLELGYALARSIPIYSCDQGRIDGTIAEYVRVFGTPEALLAFVLSGEAPSSEFMYQPHHARRLLS